MDLTLKQYELFKRNLYLYNEIDDLTSQDFIKDSNELIYTDKEIYQSNLFNIKQLYPDIDIAEKHPEINIYLNSFGGACYPGLSIYDNIIQLNKHAKTNIIASGSCMSMALIILLAVPLEQRKCLKNTTFLIHQPIRLYCPF